jgi:hypothetical protein
VSAIGAASTRPPIYHAYLNFEILSAGLCVLDEYIEVTVFVEDACVQELILGAPRPRSLLVFTRSS